MPKIEKPMNNMIDYYIREVYGVKHRYIADEKMRTAISRLTGRKTITEEDMKALEFIGFYFNQVLAK